MTTTDRAPRTGAALHEAPRTANAVRGFAEDRPRRDAIVLASLSAALFALLSLRGFVGSEIRYAEAGREMVESGDWVVPHLAYVPYMEKPVLLYWAEAACQAAFGLHPLAARLPSIAASVAGVLVTYALGRELRGARFGRGAAGLLLASGMFLVMGSVLTTDPLFSALLGVSWWSWWRHHTGAPGPSIWVFWTALGLAALTKGPLALVMTGLSIGTYLAVSRRLRDVLSMRLVRGAAIVFAVNVPWNVLVDRRDPRLLEFFYVRQNLQAFTDGAVNHAGPVWYYVPVLVGVFFPWSAVLACALPAQLRTIGAAALRRFRGREPAEPSLRVYLVSIVVPAFLFLSVSGSKLSTYAMPLFPAVAVLVADRIAGEIERPGRWLRRSLAVQAAVVAAAVAAAPFVGGRAAETLARVGAWDAALLAACVVVVLAGSLGAVRLVARARVAAGLTVLGACTAAVVVALDLAAFEIAPHLTAARVVGSVAPRIAAGERVVVASRLCGDYSIQLALRRRVQVLGEARELGMGHFVEATSPRTPLPGDPYGVDAASLPENPRLVGARGLAAAWRGPDRVWFIGRTEDVEALGRAGLDVFPVASDAKQAVVSNRPGGETP